MLLGDCTPLESDYDTKYAVPTVEELGVKISELHPCLYPGGETEALERLERVTQNEVTYFLAFILI